MKLDITQEQYDLIREALEQYYYICDEDGELKDKTKDINVLEDLLSKQKDRESNCTQDITININIDKMTGDESDINRFAKALTEKLKRSQGIR